MRQHRPTLRGLLGAVGAAAGLASVAGLFGGFGWLLDLASHFRIQYAVVLSVVMLALLVERSFRLALVSAGFAALNLALILPLYLNSGSGFGGSDALPLRAMLVNVHTSNTDHDAVLNAVVRYDPDILLLEEVNDSWLTTLAALHDRYPHRIEESRDDNFGIALYSKLPFEDAEILQIGPVPVPSVKAGLRIKDRGLVVLGTHAVPPVSAQHTQWRDEQVAAIAAAIRGVERPVLLLGDLNATPWSHGLRRLLRTTDLHDACRGSGFQPTWPSGNPLMWIPIDHVLHTPGIRVLAKEVGGFVGSDHYPVVVELGISSDGR